MPTEVDVAGQLKFRYRFFNTDGLRRRFEVDCIFIGTVFYKSLFFKHFTKIEFSSFITSSSTST